MELAADLTPVIYGVYFVELAADLTLKIYGFH